MLVIVDKIPPRMVRLVLDNIYWYFGMYYISGIWNNIFPETSFSHANSHSLYLFLHVWYENSKNISKEPIIKIYKLPKRPLFFTYNILL